ncbi:MAG: complex I NDUFA9 subunit family protein, partial [Xanthomonadales bacterium]|nr:complex I NDUFA9 subunit family protein [Xanthomonadales bacterium]
MRIVLVGGSGFLGHYLVRAFQAAGHQSVVLTRQAVRHRDVQLLRGVKLVQADVHDPDALRLQFTGADAVISMAGILNQGMGGSGFQRVHVELVEKIVDACQATGTRRLLHISALNAGKGESQYLESKGQAEQVVNAARDLDSTIFQPSVIFGPGDSFFNRFAGLLRFIPVMPLACGDSKLQPVYSVDVANAVSSSLNDPGTFGRSFELGGPSVYRLVELVRFTAATLGLKRLVIPQPDALSIV